MRHVDKADEDSFHASISMIIAKDDSLWNTLLSAYIIDENDVKPIKKWIDMLIELDSVGIIFKKPPLLPMTDTPNATFIQLSFHNDPPNQ